VGENTDKPRHHPAAFTPNEIDWGRAIFFRGKSTKTVQFVEQRRRKGLGPDRDLSKQTRQHGGLPKKKKKKKIGRILWGTGPCNRGGGGKTRKRKGRRQRRRRADCANRKPTGKGESLAKVLTGERNEKNSYKTYLEGLGKSPEHELEGPPSRTN